MDSCFLSLSVSCISAEFFTQTWKLGFPQNIQNCYAEVQTAHHKCTEDDEMDCKLFMDFDMAVLGRPWPQYEAYSRSDVNLCVTGEGVGQVPLRYQWTEHLTSFI
jgi:hypothetical protein